MYYERFALIHQASLFARMALVVRAVTRVSEMIEQITINQN